MANSNSTTVGSSVELDLDDITTVRNALLIGLDAMGEIHRVRDEFNACESIGAVAPARNYRPLDPAGGANVMGMFATALRLLEIASDEPVSQS